MNPQHRAHLAAYLGQHQPPADEAWLPNTPSAIKKFQRFHGLVPDGIIGPQTRKAMRETNSHLGMPPVKRKPHRKQYTAPNPAAHRVYVD